MVAEAMNIPGAKAAIKAFMDAKKGDVVSEDEVMRRVQICGGCHQKKRKSSIITSISRTLGHLANRHRVPDEISKFRCDACKCSLMLLIPSKTLHPDTPEEEEARPSKCWVLTTEKQAAKRKQEEARGGCPNC
jgi:hypothetical protein